MFASDLQSKRKVYVIGVVDPKILLEIVLFVDNKSVNYFLQKVLIYSSL